jgi:hypothetical protein
MAGMTGSHAVLPVGSPVNTTAGCLEGAVLMVRTGAPKAWLNAWNPGQLPMISQPRKNPWQAPFEIGTNLFPLP